MQLREPRAKRRPRFTKRLMRWPNMTMKVRCLQRSDVCSLQPLLAFDDLELNGLALFKRSVALGQNRALMHENVAPVFALDEAVALVHVKPFHYSLFFAH